MRRRKARRALILGAGGFLGGAVVADLAARGYAVTAVRRAAIARHVEGHDIVVDAAAPAPLGLESDDRGAIARMRELVSAVRRHDASLVFVSTFTTLRRDDSLGARWRRDTYPYFRLKETLESIALEAPKTIVLNPAACIGPGERRDRSLVGMVIEQRLPGIMAQTLNVIDVRDVAASVHRAVDERLCGRPIPLAGHNIALVDLVRDIARMANGAPPTFVVDSRLAQAGAFWTDLMFGFAGRAAPSALRAIPFIADAGPMARSAEQRRLGIEPRALETTLRDAIAWHQRVRR